MKCNKLATLTYVWNGAVHYACPECFAGVQALCAHMGWPLSSTLVDGTEKCPQELPDPPKESTDE